MILKVENKIKKVLWFRRDLRVDDSKLLSIEGEVLPIFIFDKNILNFLDKNDKRVDFIFKSIIKLKKDLKNIGLDLLIFYGIPNDVFVYLNSLGLDKVYASVDYDKYSITRDKEIESFMDFERLNDSYIFDCDEILKKDGTAYKVFTPFFKEAQKRYIKEYTLLYKKAKQSLFEHSYDEIVDIKNNILKKLPLNINSIGFNSTTIVYEKPQIKLKEFSSKISEYEEGRNFLGLNGSSKLSMDIRFGTISIREILRFIASLKEKGFKVEAFFRQLIFRDFYAYLLFHFPFLEKEDFRFKAPSEFNEEKYQSFIDAKTGVPIIDASIMELKTTGYMHNRARMISASYFCKQLLLPWQKGEEFFAKYLMDYDKASNILSWQWCSSTGVDAQPYFRVFNPYLQSKKFDKEALYIKKNLPFLKNIKSSDLHKESFLLNNHIENYNKPIVINEIARKEYLKKIKNNPN